MIYSKKKLITTKSEGFSIFQKTFSFCLEKYIPLTHLFSKGGYPYTILTHVLYFTHSWRFPVTPFLGGSIGVKIYFWWLHGLSDHKNRQVIRVSLLYSGDFTGLRGHYPHPIYLRTPNR